MSLPSPSEGGGAACALRDFTQMRGTIVPAESERLSLSVSLRRPHDEHKSATESSSGEKLTQVTFRSNKLTTRLRLCQIIKYSNIWSNHDSNQLFEYQP